MLIHACWGGERVRASNTPENLVPQGFNGKLGVLTVLEKKVLQ